jgi:serine/threonine protein kinase
MHCPSCQAQNADSAGVCIACGGPLYVIGGGTVLARRYQIIEPLGRGGMGVVYKARDLQLDETVALKVLRPDIASQGARRFTSEIKLARKVRHRNVCAIHEYHEDGALRFIAMELIEGVDLRRILREQGALPLQEAYDVAVQVALGLEAIHEVGIVHRDLKTSNLMRDARGVVRLMDFGIAKQLGNPDAAGLTATGQIVGTPEYMSPEQAQGRPIDSRSDIYALGIVVFELFTGAVPFRGPTPVSTLFKHVREPPPLDGPRAAGIPSELLPILHRALAKEPGERFATAREMADALSAARGQAMSQAMPSRAEAVRPGGATATWPALTAAPQQTEQDSTVPSARTESRTRTTAVRPARPLWHALVVVAVALLVGLTGYAYLGLGRPSARLGSSPSSSTLASRPSPTPTSTPPPLVLASSAPPSRVRAGRGDRDVRGSSAALAPPHRDTAVPASAAAAFVPGATTFTPPTSVTPRGFRDAPPGVEIRPAQAPAARAQLVIEATPSVIRRGDAYVLRYSLFNVSAAPLTIGAVSLRNAPMGQAPGSGAVEPLSRSARPQSRTLLCEERGTWSLDDPADWATTLTVVLDDGSIYSSTLRARRQ